jgi:DNA-binding LacI/PurR family transcriptional regulator
MHAVLLSTDRVSGDALESLAASQPYGLVVAERQAERLALHQVADRLSGVGVRMVQVGGDPGQAALPVVASDHKLGGELVARALVERGCDRLAWVGSMDPEIHWAADRRHSAAEVAASAGLPSPEAIRVRGFSGRAADAESFESLARAFAGHLIEYLGVAQKGETPNGRPGLLAANDIEAALTIRACRHLGWTPGVDVRIAGYDHEYSNLPESAWEPQPPCVTVDKRNADLGETAIGVIDHDPLAADSAVRKLPPTLVGLD